jgi:uncharacterized pyridoxal phosphate-containing UPF0001 family protein
MTALSFCGLMTIGSREASRSDGPNDDFTRLRQYKENLCTALQLELGSVKLNMGMSADYAEAIKQGSDVVRIGSAIFGNRT